MKRAYKYRIYPNKDQQKLLNQHFGCVRLIYNKALAFKEEQYKLGNKINCYEIKKLIPLWKEELPFLKNINSLSLQQSVLNLDTAYKRYYKKLGGEPNFKSKHKHRYSFTVPQNTKVDFDKSLVIIPKFLSGIKCVFHKKFTGKISSSTVSKTPDGKYYISILVDIELSKKELKNNTIGIDLGLKEFLITSDNQRIPNPRFLRTSLPRLKRLQRNLSKAKKGSNNKNKKRIKLALLHRKVFNQRNDFLHQVSRNLVNNNNVIAVESLAVKNMVKNKKLSKSISDVSWSRFVTFLEYKLNDRDGNLIKINTFFPSSKTCRHCGYINKELKLSDRYWCCPSCNNQIDRDLNAAVNIKLEGLRLSNTVGTTELQACGDYVSLGVNQAVVNESGSLLHNNSVICCR